MSILASEGSILQVKLEPALPVSETKLPKALAQAISSAFDLTAGPMVHVTLIPLTEKQEHVLVVNMHYAVADGWSLGVLFKDISLAYNQLKRSNGKPAAMCICMGFIARGCCMRLHGSCWVEAALCISMGVMARGCYVRLHGSVG